jgi:hypothetical protein
VLLAFAPAVLFAIVFNPASATSTDVGSVTSYRTKVGEISHNRSRSSRTLSYGRGVAITSDKALVKVSSFIQDAKGEEHTE